MSLSPTREDGFAPPLQSGCLPLSLSPWRERGTGVVSAHPFPAPGLRWKAFLSPASVTSAVGLLWAPSSHAGSSLLFLVCWEFLSERMLDFVKFFFGLLRISIICWFFCCRYLANLVNNIDWILHVESTLNSWATRQEWLRCIIFFAYCWILHIVVV